MSPSIAQVERHVARQSRAEPCRNAIPAYLSGERQTKIAQLKQAVEIGIYQVNAAQVAEKVMVAALVDILV
jgi:anti-sigma28 factor (negative regulator of flagellin synthesis)